MESIIEDLKKEFNRIKNKGYIKGIENHFGSIGRTFENELNLEENNFCVPDYNGIELKTRRGYTKSKITLFNTVPDGGDLFEVERIKNDYGFPSKKNRNFKILYAEVFGDRYNSVGLYYRFKLDVDRNDKKIYLSIIDIDNNFIERKVYFLFDTLEERLYTKLKFSAVVYAWPNRKDNIEYYRYYKMNIYKLKTFDDFISLIEEGKISLIIKIGIYLDEKRYGKTHNHGCGFSIKEEDLLKLFDNY